MKNILLTGSTRGIGKAIKNQLINEGYNVISPTRSELDLNNVESVKKYIFINKDLVLYGIINNAGVNFINSFIDLKENEFNETMRVNLISPMLLIRGFLTNMIEKKEGKIINISSIWSSVGKNGRISYSISKSSLDTLTRNLAKELAEHNILVNSVCPGYTDTELTFKNNSEKELIEIINSIPLKRLAQTKEIADLVSFLLSDKNNYITGQKILIDGGFTL